MYNISLYPLACKQRRVFNMLIACIPSILKFHAFGKLLIYDNLILVHCLVMACIHLLPFFLHLKGCVEILEFGSTVLCDLGKDNA